MWWIGPKETRNLPQYSLVVPTPLVTSADKVPHSPLNVCPHLFSAFSKCWNAFLISLPDLQELLTSVLLKSWCVYKSPGDAIKMQIPIQVLWNRAREPAFLMNPQVTPVGLADGRPLLEKQVWSTMSHWIGHASPHHSPGTIIADKIQGKKTGEQWEKMSGGVSQVFPVTLTATAFSPPTWTSLLLRDSYAVHTSAMTSVFDYMCFSLTVL